VSGGWPSATRLASESGRSLPIEWLCALILPRCVRRPDVHRDMMVFVIDSSVSPPAVNVVAVVVSAVHVSLDEAE
jgi:hypothetical protein